MKVDGRIEFVSVSCFNTDLEIIVVTSERFFIMS